MKEYLDTIYKYFPKDLHTSSLKYADTPEIKRQWELIEHSRKNDGHFSQMANTLVKHLNCSAYQDLSLRGIFDLSRKAVLYLPNNHFNEEYPCCVINVSIIAKYYSIYFTKFTGIPINTLKTGLVSSAQKSLADNMISRIIRTYYPGYKPFPMEHFDEVVPQVYSAINYNDSATYFECLITNDIL